MGLEDIALRIVWIVAAVVVFLIFVAYFVALDDDYIFKGTWFGRAVGTGGIVGPGLWVFVTELIPEALTDAGLTQFEFAVGLIGCVVAGGALGAVLDVIGWLRGEQREPPPPFG